MSMASSVALLGVIQWHTVMLTAAGALGAYWFDDLVDLDLAEATAAWRGHLPDLLAGLTPVTN